MTTTAAQQNFGVSGTGPPALPAFPADVDDNVSMTVGKPNSSERQQQQCAAAFRKQQQHQHHHPEMMKQMRYTASALDNNHNHSAERTVTTSPSNHHQDSDCGSSSGLGGTNNCSSDSSLLDSDSRDSGGGSSSAANVGASHKLLDVAATLTPSSMSGSSSGCGTFAANIPPPPPMMMGAGGVLPIGVGVMPPPLPPPPHHLVPPVLPPPPLYHDRLPGGVPSMPSVSSPSPLKHHHLWNGVPPPPMEPPTVSVAPARPLYTLTCEAAAMAAAAAAAAGYQVSYSAECWSPTTAGVPPPDVMASDVAKGRTSGTTTTTTTTNDNTACSGTTAAPVASGGAAPTAASSSAGTRGGTSAADVSNIGGSGLLPLNDGAALPPGVPASIAAAVNSGHDLFVHIHAGDSISLAVGNEIQHIPGPATIRMVSQAAPTSAIPMNVPPGHVVQQLLDRQGVLNHIIMSQEALSGNAAAAAAAAAMAAAGAYSPLAAASSSPTAAVMCSRAQGSSLLPLKGTPSSAVQQQQQQRSGATTPHKYQPHPTSAGAASTTTFSLSQQQQQVPPPPPPWSLQQQQNQQRASLKSASPLMLMPCAPLMAASSEFMMEQSFHPAFTPHHQRKWNAPPNYGTVPVAGGAGGGKRGSTHSNYSGESASANSVGPYSAHLDEAVGPEALKAQPQSMTQQSFGGGGVVENDTASTARYGIEEDERERLRETLNNIQPPIVARVGARDADIMWQELDTSEAAASGGPFPQIDASEFTYEIFVYEGLQAPRCVMQHRCTSSTGGSAPAASTSAAESAVGAAPSLSTGSNGFCLTQLKPATDYLVNIRASLPERLLCGNASPHAPFRTLPTRPDPPPLPKLFQRQSMTSINVGWRTPACNGSPITAYTLQIAKNKSEHFETVYEGLLEQWRITGLDPNAYYRIRLLARNEFGTSEPSPVLSISGIAAGLPHPLIGGPPPPTHPHPHQAHPSQGGGASSYMASQPHPSTNTSSASASHHYVSGQPHPPPSQPSSHAKNTTATSSSSSIVAHQPPPMMSIIQKPSPPTVLSVSARGVRLSWSVNNDFETMTLEMCDYSRSNPNVYAPVPNECYSASGTFAGVSGLQSNREYRFRLVGSTASGESLRSDYVAVKTHKDRYENANYHQSGVYPYATTTTAATSSSASHVERKELRNVVTPTLPPPVVQLQKVTDDAVELMWRMPRDNHNYGNPHELAYVVEASLSANDGVAPHWTFRQRCFATTATVYGTDYTMFRVQALNQRRQTTSPWSEVLHVKRTATASGSTPSSPATTAGGRHKRQQQQSQAVSTRKGSVIAAGEKQQQQQQTFKQQQQQHTLEQQQVQQQQPMKQQTPPPPPPPPLKPTNCSTPRFSAVTHESARVTWRALDGKKESSETAAEAASALYDESDAQKSSIIYELQRVDKQPPLIVYSGNAFEHVLSGLRPVEHLQARVRAVALDTEGHRVEGAWSGVGSACTPCTVSTAPLRLRCRATDAPPFSDDEPDVETDGGDGSGSCGTSSQAGSAAAAASVSPPASAPVSPAKMSRVVSTTVASEASGGRPSVYLAWDAPAQLNGSAVIEYVINALRYTPADVEQSSAKLEDVAEMDAADNLLRKWRQLTEEPERMGVVDGKTRRFYAERLSYAQLYRFTVVAVNEAGASPPSAAATWTTPAGRPDAPQHVVTEPLSVSAIRLRWTPPRANGSPLVGYHVLVYQLTAVAEADLMSETTTDNQTPAQLQQHYGKSRYQRRAVDVVRSHRHQHHHYKRVLSSQLMLSLTDTAEEQVTDEGGRPTVTYVVDGLETETLYEFTVEAKNDVGVGVRAERARCATLAPPPAPPTLALADATANSLKLRWTNAPPASSASQSLVSKSGSAKSEASYYQLERMNESGSFSPVYEGELRSAKVKGLKERCTYRFRIRAALSRDDALGAWSDVQAFTTTRQPPPGVRAAPTAIAVRDVDGVWQVEWPAVRCGAALLSNASVDAENDDVVPSATTVQPFVLRSQLVYRLQIAQKNAVSGTSGVGSFAPSSRDKESWRVVYEGASTTATVTLSPAAPPTVTRQARVFVVQKWFRVGDDTTDDPVEECVSAPSPVGLFPPTAAQQNAAAVATAQHCVEASASPRKRAVAKASYATTGPTALSPAPGGGRISVYRRLRRCLGWLKKTVSEKDCALIVLTIFVALAISIAVLLNSYYEF